MRRWLTVFSSALLAAALAVGCSDSSDSEGEAGDDAVEGSALDASSDAETTSDTDNPDPSESDTTDPEGADPDTDEPDTDDPDADDPDADDPDADDPDADDPDADDPDADGPDTDDPDTDDPDATDTGGDDTADSADDADTPCEADCEGLECGDDGCGGTCGTCDDGSSCLDGACIADCTPNCVGKDCGSDGCGGSCGDCGDGQSCNLFGACIADCVPACDGKDCGEDGCGGSCGTCEAAQSCGAAGECLAPDECTVVTPIGSLLTGVDPYQIAITNIGGPEPDYLYLEFYTDDTGLIDLGSGDNANYATCPQCVRVFEDVPDSLTDFEREYFQVEGTIDVDPESIPISGGTVSAVLNGLKLIEVTIDTEGGFVSTPVEGGNCLVFADNTFISTSGECVGNCAGKSCGDDGCGGNCGECGPDEACDAAGQCAALGPACGGPEDCPNPLSDSCDASTQTCLDGPQCALNDDCGAESICLLQTEVGGGAACYEICSPLLGDCGPSQQCVQLGFDSLAGYCTNTGTATVGEPCTGSAVNSGCATDLICAAGLDDGPPVCTTTCSIFADSPGCPAAQTCAPFGFCVVEAVVSEPTPIGGGCIGEVGAFCGDSGQAIAGACGLSGMCQTLCQLASPDCPGEQTCVDAFGIDVGLCE